MNLPYFGNYLHRMYIALSRDDLNKSIPLSYYTELLTHFNNAFPYLTEEFKPTYDNCKIIAESLSNNGYSYSDLESLM